MTANGFKRVLVTGEAHYVGSALEIGLKPDFTIQDPIHNLAEAPWAGNISGPCASTLYARIKRT